MLCAGHRSQTWCRCGNAFWRGIFAFAVVNWKKSAVAIALICSSHQFLFLFGKCGWFLLENALRERCYFIKFTLLCPFWESKATMQLIAALAGFVFAPTEFELCRTKNTCWDLEVQDAVATVTRIRCCFMSSWFVTSFVFLFRMLSKSSCVNAGAIWCWIWTWNAQKEMYKQELTRVNFFLPIYRDLLLLLFLLLHFTTFMCFVLPEFCGLHCCFQVPVALIQFADCVMVLQEIETHFKSIGVQTDASDLGPVHEAVPCSLVQTVRSHIFSTLDADSCPDEVLKYKILSCSLGLLSTLNHHTLERMDCDITALAILEIAIGLEGIQDKGMREIQDKCRQKLGVNLAVLKTRDTLSILRSVVINSAWGNNCWSVSVRKVTEMSWAVPLCADLNFIGACVRNTVVFRWLPWVHIDSEWKLFTKWLQLRGKVCVQVHFRSYVVAVEHCGI